MKTIRSHSTVLLACLLAGPLLFCKATVHGQTVHESFTSEAITHGDLAVGGMTSAVTPLDPQKRSILADAFRRSVIDEHEGYRVASAGDVENRLGTEIYAAMIDEFEQRGELSQERLAGIAEALADTRYLMMPRIESDLVTGDRWERRVGDPQTAESIQASLQTGSAPSEGDVQYTRETSRRVRVGLVVYDLTTRGSVWSGSVTASGSRTNTHTEVESDSDDLLIDVLDWLADDGEDYPERPEAPLFQDMLELAFVGLAENLPEED